MARTPRLDLVLLLSPAHCRGRRARALLGSRAGSEAALRLRTGTLTLGDAFAFMSSRDLAALPTRLGPAGQAVLLGSIASGKYVDVLGPALGARLHYPPAFIGRGDMSRGGLLLRHAAAGTELDYAPLSTVAPRHGPRPPKLERR